MVALTASTFYRLKKHLPILIANGNEYVEGFYLETDELVNGKPVYVHSRDDTICIHLASCGRWSIARVSDKDLRNGMCRGLAAFAGPLHPAMVNSWQLVSAGKLTDYPSLIVSTTVGRLQLPSNNPTLCQSLIF